MIIQTKYMCAHSACDILDGGLRMFLSMVNMDKIIFDWSSSSTDKIHHLKSFFFKIISLKSSKNALIKVTQK